MAGDVPDGMHFKMAYNTRHEAQILNPEYAGSNNI